MTASRAQRWGDSHRFSIVVALAALASLLLAALGSFLVVDPDLFHEMALARVALERGSIPTEELFAFTPTVDPSVHHEWGTGMVLYFLVTRCGAAGLLALKYLLGFAVAFLTLKAARLQKTGWEVLCLLAPVALPMADLGFTNVRAQFFTLLFVSAFLVATQWDRDGRRSWIVPWLLVFVVWLNMHGGFVVAFVLLACHWLEQVVRRRRAGWHLIGCAVAMGGLTLVNPYGADYLAFLRRALLMPRPRIGEWLPIWASPSLTIVFAVSLLVAAYAWRQGGTRPLNGALAVALFAVAAAWHIRHVSIYALVWMAYVPGWFETTPMGSELGPLWSRNRRAAIGVSLGVVVAGVGLALWLEPWRLRVPVDLADLERGTPVVYPEGAAQYLRDTRFEGNVLTPFVEGLYVSWRLYPHVKVGLDGRYEVAYRPGVAEEILAFYDASPGWSETLAKYPSDLVLVGAYHAIGPALAAGTDWRPVYQDDLFSLYARPGLALPVVDARGKKIEGRFP